MAQVPPDETVTATPIASPTYAVAPVFRDCGWIAEARAFVDTNANGKWDKGERGLTGVSFHLDDLVSQEHDVASVKISDNHGRAEITAFVGGCFETEIEVYAVPPNGYISTTPERVSEKDVSGDEPFVFGFKRMEALPGMPGTGHP